MIFEFLIGQRIHTKTTKGTKNRTWSQNFWVRRPGESMSVASATMERMIALGVDDLITNDPEEALRCVRSHEALTPSERTLHRVHAWLAH